MSLDLFFPYKKSISNKRVWKPVYAIYWWKIQNTLVSSQIQKFIECYQRKFDLIIRNAQIQKNQTFLDSTDTLQGGLFYWLPDYNNSINCIWHIMSTVFIVYKLVLGNFVVVKLHFKILIFTFPVKELIVERQVPALFECKKI